MVNILLCGGSGKRLWPLSRALMPKQFIKLFGKSSLFQLTVDRNKNVCDEALIVTNDKLYFTVQNQLSQLNFAHYRYLIEGVAKNTAAAITLAALLLDKNDIMLVTPADHVITDNNAYYDAISQAKKLAIQGHLVTLGVKPSYPETGYGYIKANGYDVDYFCEKPTKIKAKKYLGSGDYYWNSGIFCFKVCVILDELKQHSLSIYEQCVKAIKHIDNNKIPKEYMNNIATDSIDYAVMEKSNNIKVVELDVGWSDIGDFNNLSKQLKNDDNNNLIISDKSDKVVKTIDVHNSVIIDTADALLVTKKSSAQKINTLVNSLQKTNPELTDAGVTGYRPWGNYTILDKGVNYKIKRIEVMPSKRISLQRHKFRNEHWVVIKGIATITLNDKVFKLHQNESTYIKAGDKHRLTNDTNDILIIIESQIGSYTGEDDIERFDDDFGRESQ